MAFIEKTDFEKGFAARWDSEIEPRLAGHNSAYRARLWLSILSVPFGVIFFIGIYAPLVDLILPRNPEAENIWFVFFGLFLSLLVIALLNYPLSKLLSSFDDFMRNVVSDHYGSILVVEENRETADLLRDRLRELKLISGDKGLPRNHYRGSYRDCALEMFNVSLSVGSGEGQSSVSYFILNISVPMEFDGEVVIKSDFGQLFNSLRRLFSDKKRIKFEHPKFEKVFEVFAADEDLARRLITLSFCDNLLSVRKLFPKIFGRTPFLVAAFHDGSFSLVVENSDIFALKFLQSTPKRIEGGCRHLIARMGIIKNVVDHLHGDY